MSVLCSTGISKNAPAPFHLSRDPLPDLLVQHPVQHVLEQFVPTCGRINGTDCSSGVLCGGKAAPLFPPWTGQPKPPIKRAKSRECLSTLAARAKVAPHHPMVARVALSRLVIRSFSSSLLLSISNDELVLPSQARARSRDTASMHPRPSMWEPASNDLR